MKKQLLTLALLTPLTATATGLHLSPEFKVGPYLTSGISGGGMQLGVTDVLGLDALYVSYAHTSADFMYDKDRLKTYRIGGQYQLVEHPMKMALQLEGGVVEYEGSRDYIFSDRVQYVEGTGATISASWVVFINENVGFRIGSDFHYIDKSKTLFDTNWSATVSSGVVFHF